MDDSGPFAEVSTMRLYGGAVGVASGAYSVWLATGEMGTTAATFWPMLVVGLVALGHGAALFTPAARPIGRASGPLMLAYAVAMLLLQGWMATMATGGGMDGGAGDGMNGGMNAGVDGAAAMGADPGMVALAALMLFSGALMTLRRGMLD